MAANKRVAYFMIPKHKHWYIGPCHPLIPFRLHLTDSLVQLYGGIDNRLTRIINPAPTSMLEDFHTKDYVDFLQKVHPRYEGGQFGFDKDCPGFCDILDYVLTSVSGAWSSAFMLRNQMADVAINWHGGYHHARPDRASGFCYANDLVIAIQELHRTFQRVLYLDIDAHHGDAVEEAFKSSQRVFTLSLHKYDGEFFPRTGDLDQMGAGGGLGYSLNLPLKDGLGDENHKYLLDAVLPRVVESYRPEAIVMQSGADSLAGDPIGPHNLTEKAYGKAVKLVKNFGLPLLLTGGGGYNVPNVARCWAYETAVAAGGEDSVPTIIPKHSTLIYYMDNHFRTSVRPMKVVDKNSRSYLDSLVQTAHERMRRLEAAPSVALGRHVV